jgi:hypothetical protein
MRDMNRAAQQNRARQLFWKLLSLWAVLALAVPSLAWACPMNGRVTHNSAAVCHCLQEAQSGNSAALDASLHKCCKQVPLPASDTSGDHKNGSALIPQLSGAKIAAPSVASTPAAFASFALPSPTQALSLEFSAVATSTHSPPRVLSQHNLRQNSGRSPPR